MKDLVGAKRQRVLRCEAHGDQYDGPVTGQWKRKKRVGGVLVSRQHFASGRFEVVMKIGSTANPRPKGIVPAIWTYGYRAVSVPDKIADHFSPTQPLYHPSLQKWGKGQAFYWSEIDFPEFGKGGKFDRPMYNTFLNSKHQPLTFDVHGAADGRYHTYTTEWRTGLVPIKGVKDSQVAKAKGFYWIQDKAVDFGRYFGNPLKRLGRDRYAVCSGLTARHWIDGRFIGGDEDHLARLRIDRPRLGYVETGYESWREFGLGTGGYLDGMEQSPYGLAIAPYLDHERVWLAAGLAKRDMPQLDFTYEQLGRNGRLAMQQWGGVPVGEFETRSVYPAAKSVEETIHRLSLRAEHDIGDNVSYTHLTLPTILLV